MINLSFFLNSMLRMEVLRCKQELEKRSVRFPEDTNSSYNHLLYRNIGFSTRSLAQKRTAFGVLRAQRAHTWRPRQQIIIIKNLLENSQPQKGSQIQSGLPP